MQAQAGLSYKRTKEMDHFYKDHVRVSVNSDTKEVGACQLATLSTTTVLRPEPQLTGYQINTEAASREP